jgi:hypothetical protein
MHQIFIITQFSKHWFLLLPLKRLLKKNGGTTKAFQDRAAKWAKIYGEEAVKNIDINGEMLSGELKEDVTTCSAIVLPALK